MLLNKELKLVGRTGKRAPRFGAIATEARSDPARNCEWEYMPPTGIMMGPRGSQDQGCWRKDALFSFADIPGPVRIRCRVKVMRFSTPCVPGPSRVDTAGRTGAASHEKGTVNTDRDAPFPFSMAALFGSDGLASRYSL